MSSRGQKGGARETVEEFCRANHKEDLIPLLEQVDDVNLDKLVMAGFDTPQHEGTPGHRKVNIMSNIKITIEGPTRSGKTAIVEHMLKDFPLDTHVIRSSNTIKMVGGAYEGAKKTYDFGNQSNGHIVEIKEVTTD